MALELKNLYDNFRDANTIKAYAKLIKEDAKKLPYPINIMEVCGGHTHSIMRYGIKNILPTNIDFIHGPGCPVCVMPKQRIDQAYALAMVDDVILVTLGDMIKVPGSDGSLQDARANGGDVRFVYSPLECLKIANENRDKKIVFFAIGFETTTPMSAALIDAVIKQNIKNIYFHINHVTVPEVMCELLEDTNKIDAFLAPSHVSVITGSKIYELFAKRYKKPIVVSGFEPVDMMHSISMIVKQFIEKRVELEIEYKRVVSYDGNIKAQKMIDDYFIKRDSFRWRGLGDVKNSAFKLRDEYKELNAEVIYKDIFSDKTIDDHVFCICGDILKGIAKPNECSLFAKVCKPSTPVGSCMVSSEGACAAYYKYL